MTFSSNNSRRDNYLLDDHFYENDIFWNNQDVEFEFEDVDNLLLGESINNDIIEDVDTAENKGYLHNTSNRVPRQEWRFHFAALLEYCKENGTCNIPPNSTYECNLSGMFQNDSVYHYLGKLGSWLTRQRKELANPSNSKITADQLAQLQSLVDQGSLSLRSQSYHQQVSDELSITWLRHYAALSEYYKEFGTCNVPQKTIYKCQLPNIGGDGKTRTYQGKLGRWLDDQRQAKKGYGGKRISPDQLAKLQLLVDEGKLDWSVRDDSQNAWSMHYAALLEYYKEHGTCNVPANCKYECELPTLSENKPARLYKGKLGVWLNDQRQAKKGNGTCVLKPDQLAKLQALVDQGILAWSIRRCSQLSWSIHYEALLEYHKEHGTCNVPRKCLYECQLASSNQPYKGKLGSWLSRQRQAKRGGEKSHHKISRDHILKLQELVDQGYLRW